MAETNRAPEVHDVDKTVNSAKAMRFLAKYPDATSLDMSDHEEIAKRMEVFKTKEGVAKSLSELFIGDIKADLGIDIPKGSLDAVSDHIEAMAINSPDEFIALKDKLEKNSANKKKVTEYFDRIQKAGGVQKMEEARDKYAQAVDDLETYKNYKGKWGKVKKFGLALGSFVSSGADSKLTKINSAQSEVERQNNGQPMGLAELNGAMDVLQRQIGDINMALDKMPELESLRAELEGIKTEVIGGVLDMGDVRAKVKEAWTKKFDDLMA